MEPLTQTERDWGTRLAPPRGEGCLDAETLLSIAQKGRQAPRAEAAFAHIAACPGCRTLLKELRALEKEAPAPAKPTWTWMRGLPWVAGLAAAALLLVVAFQVFGPSSGLRSSAEPIAKNKPDRATSPHSESPRLDPTRLLPVPEPKSTSSPESRPIKETKSPRQGRSAKPRRDAVPPVPIVDRSVEMMDANVGWSRDELSGEVVGGNQATGEVVAPNQVQGEVGRGGPEPSPQQN